MSTLRGTRRYRSMSERAWIWITTGIAVVVVAVCFVVAGTALDGVVLATRYSARFSALVLATALIARAPRPFGLNHQRVALTLAFAAAHGVHYSTVIARAFLDPEHKLRHPGPVDLAGLVGGAGLILVIAVTAKASSAARSRLNAIAFYAAWAILLLASGSRFRTSIPSVVVLGVLVVAMLWRVASTVAFRGQPRPTADA